MGFDANVKIGTLLGTDRPPANGDDLRPLVESIAAEGLHKPALLMSVDGESLVLIDGLRRLRALEALDRKEIPAFIVSDLQDALERIPDIQDDSDLAFPLNRRWVDLYHLDLHLRVLGKQHLRKARSSKTSRGLSWRRDVNSRLGIHDDQVRALRKLQEVLKEPGVANSQVAKTALAAMDQGELLPGGALWRIMKHAMRGSVTKASQQEEILRSIQSALRGVTRSLKDLGPLAEDLDKDEMRHVAKDFRAFASRIRAYSRNMENHVNV